MVYRAVRTGVLLARSRNITNAPSRGLGPVLLSSTWDQFVEDEVVQIQNTCDIAVVKARTGMVKHTAFLTSLQKYYPNILICSGPRRPARPRTGRSAGPTPAGIQTKEAALGLRHTVVKVRFERITRLRTASILDPDMSDSCCNDSRSSRVRVNETNGRP